MNLAVHFTCRLRSELQPDRTQEGLQSVALSPCGFPQPTLSIIALYDVGASIARKGRIVKSFMPAKCSQVGPCLLRPILDRTTTPIGRSKQRPYGVPLTVNSHHAGPAAARSSMLHMATWLAVAVGVGLGCGVSVGAAISSSVAAAASTVQ